MRRRLIGFSAAVLTAATLSAEALSPQVERPSPTATDAIAQGLYWLYQLQYDKALAAFDRYSRQYPDDPAGPFYRAGTHWWHLAQNFDYPLPDIQKAFDNEVSITINKAKALAESSEDPKVKARSYLYRGGAEGLKGRWLVTQKQWVKAYFAGKNGSHFLRLAVRYDPTLYDAYLGLGIYDYFTDTFGGVQKALAALLVRGDRKRGIQQLELAVEKAPHARVEAMIFLIEIYTSEEHQPAKALPITKQLRTEFPQSPLAHLAQIMTYYSMKQWADVKRESQTFVDRSRKESPYYTKDGIRPGLYCLGVSAMWHDHDLDRAYQLFAEILESGADTSRWVTFAYLRRGQIYDQRGEREKALEDYRRVLSRPDFWGSHKEAKQYMSRPLKS
jgi:tetratricopeptide (TPR) repeat protein